LDLGEKRHDSGHQYPHMSTKEKNIIFCCLWFKNQTNKDGKIEGKSVTIKTIKISRFDDLLGGN